MMLSKVALQVLCMVAFASAETTLKEKPSEMAAWPMDAATKAPLPCPTTKTLAAFPTWPGTCTGTLKMPGHDKPGEQLYTKVSCQTECLARADCSLWIFKTPKEATGDSVQSVITTCELGIPDDGNGLSTGGDNCYGALPADAESTVVDGARIMHGEVKTVGAPLEATYVDGLYVVGIGDNTNGTENIRRCKNVCFSDINCRFWFYGADGCHVERSPANLVKDSNKIHNGTAAAKMVGTGGQIEHFCTEHSSAKANESSESTLMIVGIVLAVLAGLAIIAGIMTLVRGRIAKTKLSRQVKTGAEPLQDDDYSEEDGEE